MEDIEKERFYRPDELAKRYDVSNRTITRLIQKQKIPALKIGRQIRIKGINVIAFEEKHTQNPR